ncbi:hypothetical protein [Mycobacterium sp. IEC1808]|uniref:hypothetical protein n=1 Tax=Mycobacterium sp. IEC1808 TaxID=1743230 RepID=UPI001150ACB9|nr:hypothetical protein [Mycobacterium sp. IEC1808]
MSLGQIYRDIAPGLSLVVSAGAVWYARDKAVREAQALPLQETYDGLWTIKKHADSLYSELNLDRIVSNAHYASKGLFPVPPDVPPELVEAIARLRVSKTTLVSPSAWRIDRVIAAAEALNKKWSDAYDARTRNLDGQTEQSLGWTFGFLETELRNTRDLTDRTIVVVSQIMKRKLLRRWYYKPHWAWVQRMLDIRIHSAAEERTAE